MGGKNSKKPSRNDLYKEDAIKTESEILVNLTNEVLVPRLKNDPISDYDNVGTLGEGSYGTVYKVQNKLSKEMRAMKVLKKSSTCSEQDDKETFNEIFILEQLDHPNIMKIYEFYSNRNYYSIVTELCEKGDLFNKIIKKGPMSEEHCALIMYQLLHAVNYFHKMKVVHRDLKPENILIAETERKGYPFIKICDFGTATMYEKGKIDQKAIGTPYYVAPEVLRKKYNEKCDLWSCGVILYVLFTQIPPFPGDSEKEIISNVVKGEYDTDFGPFRKCSKEILSLLEGLLCKDPSKRLSAEMALEHPFFKKFKAKENFNQILSKRLATSFINNLKSYKRVSVIQETALAYLVHNFSQRKDIVNAGRLFNQFDLSQDGKISREELYKALKSWLPDEDNLKEEVNFIFKNIDSSNNGYIEYEEFIRASVDKKSFLDERILKFAFRFFDKDRSGLIDLEEVEQIFENYLVGQKGVKDAFQKIISEVDMNNDQKISFNEFEVIMKKMLLN